MVTQALWPGPYTSEAVLAFRRAHGQGMNSLRSLVVGCVASFKDCWMFQRKLAERLGCSLRTVQRALHQARELGLVETHRSKLGEHAPGLDQPVPCGWSHRWAIGWGQAVAVARVAVDVARVTRLTAVFGRRRSRTAEPAARRSWTAEEIDAELARRRSQAPPG